MGSFFVWLLGSFFLVALLLLLFPVVLRIDFEIGMEMCWAHFFLFKKKLYSFEKRWKEKDDEFASQLKDEKKDASGEACCEPEFVATAPSEPSAMCAKEPGSPAIPEVKKPETAETFKVENPKAGAPDVLPKEKKVKKEKRKLTDREFWTILLTPELDVKAFKYVKKLLGAMLKVFRVKFRNCFVEGIRMRYLGYDYAAMGYAAALNGFLKSFPYVGAWDFRMDWCNDKVLRASGTIFASVNLCRILGFLNVLLFYVGILGVCFWRRRSHVFKTNELPELGFVRKKILALILEE